MTKDTRIWKEGGCHCGAVRFRVRDRFEKVLDCNCSICRKKGFLHLIVPKSDFTSLTPEENMTLYQFNTKTAKHWFCSTCGVAPFYVPRSHPDGFDVNARCIDDLDLNAVRIETFDGDQWEQQIDTIAGYET
ncbi:GFA family protein [Acanthopleuribacter pedis]|uniref:GFA family protein n=1 Tax=Acanthopleuribacter pedis TaxID=442870 RepID=A0A8J7U854_9BACT|nr:GFA family protein [Acanthopleuribacter pedis]MBO1322131.1 GFA family protein [Acanthopleuribacter pedis]